MLELIARTSKNPEVLLNLAQRHLQRHEWGRARLVLEQLDASDSSAYRDQVNELLQDIIQRLDGCCSQENKT